MAKQQITLVKVTLLTVCQGAPNDARLEAMCDRLAEQLRDEDHIITVASEYDAVETTGPVNDDDALAELLTKQFPPDALPVGPCPGIKVLGRNGTFRKASLKRLEDRFELWLGTEKERFPLVCFPAPRLEAADPCPSCGVVAGSNSTCPTCKERRLRELVP